MSLTVPRVISKTELPSSEAKWVTLNKIVYANAKGEERIWESAERKTRKSSGVDAVGIFTILRSATNAFPPSTIIIEQYRPPVDQTVIELPAGLVDDGETPSQAAIRELEEETGYRADEVLEVSPLLVSDAGMSNANMHLITLRVTLPDQLVLPPQKLEEGEVIVRRVIELSQLKDELKAYSQKGFAIASRLYYFAAGYSEAVGKLI